MSEIEDLTPIETIQDLVISVLFYLKDLVFQMYEFLDNLLFAQRIGNFITMLIVGLLVWAVYRMYLQYEQDKEDEKAEKKAAKAAAEADAPASETFVNRCKF